MVTAHRADWAAVRYRQACKHHDNSDKQCREKEA
tara:strand:- start:13750 stop:13851 length:102 start_codon:yes stop_codon:yes gene_type:complete